MSDQCDIELTGIEVEMGDPERHTINYTLVFSSVSEPRELTRQEQSDLDFIRGELNKSVREHLANSNGRDVDIEKSISQVFDDIKPFVSPAVESLVSNGVLDRDA